MSRAYEREKRTERVGVGEMTERESRDEMTDVEKSLVQPIVPNAPTAYDTPGPATQNDRDKTAATIRYLEAGNGPNAAADVKAKKSVPITNHPLHKTVICKDYDKPGGCPYGDRCSFAHGQLELRARPEPVVAPAEAGDRPSTIDIVANIK